MIELFENIEKDLNEFLEKVHEEKIEVLESEEDDEDLEEI